MLKDVIIYDCETKEYTISKEDIKELPNDIYNTPSIEDKIDTLEKIIKVQDEMINVNMMATDEVYTMIEPLLAQTPMPMMVSTFGLTKERRVSKMVDLYVAMVMRGLKTIEEVPSRYREEVKAILEKLEK